MKRPCARERGQGRRGRQLGEALQRPCLRC
jgi:hypothetical protein